jgi:hypothetical protein
MPHTSPCKEEREVDDQQQARSRPTRKQLLWTVGVLAGIVVIVGACIFLRFAYVREWKWTGLVKNPDFHKRTLWDWLNLLIVPAVLALGGYLFTRSENRRTQKNAEQQRDLDSKIADLDREIAYERQQDDTLQAYLDGMSPLLTDENRPLYRAQAGDNLSTVARARTLTVLPRLAGNRKGSVVQFLHGSGLIAKNRPIIVVIGADLREADLRHADLRGAVLWEADLRDADLRDAYLGEAYLGEADLSGADLSEAYLEGARGWTEEQLRAATSLEGATMPDGQKYED